MSTPVFPATPSRTDDDSSSITSNDIPKERYQERISTLPKVESWFNVDIRLYEGWYCPSSNLPGLMCMQKHFKAQSSDVFFASFPKTGTTWLKALIFAIAHRTCYKKEDHPLLTNVSHDLVQTLESRLYIHGKPSPVIDDIPSPRIFHTHIPYGSLPRTITDSSCKFVYIARDPKDVLVSFWYFSSKVVSRWFPENKEAASMTLEEACDLFCQGVCPYGSFWDHVLRYWKASIEQPQRFLFLKYEDIKRKPQLYTKKLAEFLGQPFSLQEEEEGVTQNIVDLCSFRTLSNIQVNKMGSTPKNIAHDSFYRKGEVEDWKNHLTLDMAERIDKITKQNFHTHGLIF